MKRKRLLSQNKPSFRPHKRFKPIFADRSIPAFNDIHLESRIANREIFFEVWIQSTPFFLSTSISLQTPNPSLLLNLPPQEDSGLYLLSKTLLRDSAVASLPPFLSVTVRGFSGGSSYFLFGIVVAAFFKSSHNNSPAKIPLPPAGLSFFPSKSCVLFSHRYKNK